MFPQHRILLLIIQVVLAVNVCNGEDYYVTPTPPPNPDCPASKICNTLDYYAANSSVLFDNKDNISLLFLNGSHNLTRKFRVQNTTYFYLSGILPSDNDSVRISIVEAEFPSDDVFTFSGIAYLSFVNMTFSATRNSHQPAAGLAQCVYIKDTQQFVGYKLVFESCTLNASYLFENSSFLMHTEHIDLSSDISQSTQFVFQDSHFYNGNVSIECHSPQHFIFPALLNATFNQSTIFWGGLSVVADQTNVTLSIHNAFIMHGHKGIELVLTKAVDKSISLNVSIVNLYMAFNAIGISIDQSGDYGKINPKQSTILSISLADAFLTDNNQGVIVQDSSAYSRLDVIDILFLRSQIISNRGTGLYLYTNDNLNVTMLHCTLEKNSGIGLYITGPYNSEQNTSVCVTNTNMNFNHDGLVLQRSNAQLYFANTQACFNKRTGIVLATLIYSSEISTVNFDTCTVAQNGQVGLNIQMYHDVRVHILNSQFDFNSNKPGSYRFSDSRGSSASALMIVCQSHFSNRSSIIIRDSTFNHNQDNTSDNRIVRVFQCLATVFEGINTFEGNIGTPVEMYQSNLYVSGTVTFKNNSAYRGGGLRLIYSKLYVQNNTFIHFHNNAVSDTGGAIYYPTVKEDISEFCFYQLNISKPEEAKTLNTEISFTNNSAMNGGEDIFGAAVNDLCSVAPDIESYRVYKSIFNFFTASLSSISSEPTRVCLCDNQGVPQCSHPEYILSTLEHPLYPGESFYRSVVIVGKEFGTVSGSVYADFVGIKAKLDTNQYSQVVSFDNCQDLQYTISLQEPAQIFLALTASVTTVQTVISEKYLNYLIEQYKDHNYELLLNLPVYTKITIEDCPLGFSLTKEPPYKCDCDESLTSNGVDNCIIQNHTGYIYRSNTIWIGALNDSDDIIIHLYCPYGYCRTGNVSVDPAEPDSQCALNRTGILCGGCKDDLSLALGSYRCIHCPNDNYVALLIPIILGTVLLVVLIKLLDLTVAKGTINGLIFYANIMWSNKSIFISTDESSGAPYYITHTFLAWLNLDFGIETCFIEHLNAIGITWFHFGQDALYIIVITLMIYVSSRYSTLATRVLGNNSVPVLATMFFLSYTKLFHTVINTLGFSVLNYPNTTDLVWSLDGNVPFFSLGHSFLFVVALFALFLLWLPYTIVLTFGQCLRRKSHLYLLKWMDKQIPYFDAYYGPLKDKYHYWFGGLLIARGILLIIYAITSTIYPQFNLLAIVMVSACLLLHPYQYKRWIHSLLEKLFFLNLVFVASGVLLMDLVGGDKRPIVYTSVGIALALFVGIVIFHTSVVIVNCCANRKSGVAQDGYDNIDQVRTVQRSEEPDNVSRQIWNENAYLREPLLESSSLN